MQPARLQDPHGAVHLGGGATRFRVWAPKASAMELRFPHSERPSVTMASRESGYWEALVENAPPGTRYVYRIDGGPDRPDPASRFQPDGVHGPSEVVDGTFDWQDSAWREHPVERCVFYELHTGTFTPEGTFDAIVPHLDYLRDLGITSVELMPVAQFPGSRNWGYDGVYPFAVQNSYGGPPGLKRLVNECHKRGLGVALDVVYNHLGPEGNYFADFAPYFTGQYKTPWGPAINFDGPESDEVRRFFIENALYWIRDFHIDALRLDAVHGIFDRSAYPFLEELADAVRDEAARLNRRIPLSTECVPLPDHRHAASQSRSSATWSPRPARRKPLIAESDLNDPRLIRAKDLGGFGLDAQWADGFHHALRALLTGERIGYYQDFGELRHLAKAFEQGYVYTGEFSRFRQRRHGAPARDIPAHRFVVFSQNHDQVGNRMLGERLTRLASFEDLKLAAAAVILSPHVPLLFMGEEYAETAPFLYFVDHSDQDLVEAVRLGRKNEFAAFVHEVEPPDPRAQDTFLRSRINLELRHEDRHRIIHGYYRELLRLRREIPALATLSKEQMSVAVEEHEKVLLVRRWHDVDEVVLALCFSGTSVAVKLPLPAGRWSKLLDSADAAWLGPGTASGEKMDAAGGAEVKLKPRSAVLFRRSSED